MADSVCVCVAKLLDDGRRRKCSDCSLPWRDQTGSWIGRGHRTARHDAPSRSVLGYKAVRKREFPGSARRDASDIENRPTVKERHPAAICIEPILVIVR